MLKKSAHLDRWFNSYNIFVVFLASFSAVLGKTAQNTTKKQKYGTVGPMCIFSIIYIGTVFKPVAT